jgi:hypothetical protein
MGKLDDNFEKLEKIKSAFLTIVLLALVCKELDIEDLSVVLFSDKSFIIKEKFKKGKTLNPNFFMEIIDTISKNMS